MTLTLAQYRTRTLQILTDPNQDRYTTDEIDNGLRLALADFSTYRPILREYELDTDGNYELELPADFSAAYISAVRLWNDTPNAITQIRFTAWMLDESWFIRTDPAYPAGNVLLVSYAAPHTIDDFDGQTGTTIDDDNLLCIGAAGYAATNRATSRAETINMNPEVQAKLLQVGSNFLSQFFGRIRVIRAPMQTQPAFPEAPAF